jgi:hypothetical protein
LIRRVLLGLLSLGTLLPAAAMQIQHEPAAVAVCVVAPRVEPVEDADGAGVVPVPDPSLVVIEPLQELRIERAGLPVWRSQAREGAALPMPFLWPTAPIRPGETVLVRLRPKQAPRDAFAHVLLVGASAGRMAATADLLSSLGRSAQGWLLAIEAALQSGDVPLAWALLFAPQTPLSSDLVALRQEVVRRGCGD